MLDVAKDAQIMFLCCVKSQRRINVILTGACVKSRPNLQCSISEKSIKAVMCRRSSFTFQFFTSSKSFSLLKFGNTDAWQILETRLLLDRHSLQWRRSPYVSQTLPRKRRKKFDDCSIVASVLLIAVTAAIRTSRWRRKARTWTISYVHAPLLEHVARYCTCRPKQRWQEHLFVHKLSS